MNKEIDITSFKHVIKEKVKFHEVDMMKVVNNAVYLNYFEDARIKYLQNLKLKYNLKEIISLLKMLILFLKENITSS